MATDPTYPRAGIDYPGTWRELWAWFPDDVACAAYLERLQWPDGPKCESKKGWRTADCTHVDPPFGKLSAIATKRGSPITLGAAERGLFITRSRASTAPRR